MHTQLLHVHACAINRVEEEPIAPRRESESSELRDSSDIAAAEPESGLWAGHRSRLHVWLIAEVSATRGPVGLAPARGAAAAASAPLPPWPPPLTAPLPVPLAQRSHKGTLEEGITRGLFRCGLRGGPNVRLILETARDIADALAHMHSHSMSHGVLDPSSILLCTGAGAAPRLFTAKVRRGRQGQWLLGRMPCAVGAALCSRSAVAFSPPSPHPPACLRRCAPPPTSSASGSRLPTTR